MDGATEADPRRNGRSRPPVVDVAIPTRGQLEYLREAIESVVGQSFDSWRLTISENGSESEEIRTLVRSYLADSRIRHVVSSEGLDQSEHFTRLIRMGQAPYVALLHEDDRWGPRFLERRVSFLDSHPAAAFVFSGHVVIDDAGRSVGPSLLPLEEGVYGPASFLPLLYRENVVGVPTVVVRRAAYEAVGADYRREVGFNDHEMWLRIATRFQVGFLETRDADYRVHAQQTSSQERLTIAHKRLQLLDTVDPILSIPGSLRRRVRAEVLLKVALDEAELGERRAALASASRAVRLKPSVLLSVSGAARASALFAGLALGEVGRAWLTRSRLRRWQRHGID